MVEHIVTRLTFKVWNQIEESLSGSLFLCRNEKAFSCNAAAYHLAYIIWRWKIYSCFDKLVYGLHNIQLKLNDSA